MSLESLFPRRQVDTDEVYVSIRNELNRAVLESRKNRGEDFRNRILSAMDNAAQLYYGLNGAADEEWMKSFYLNGARPYTANVNGDISDTLQILGHMESARSNPEKYGKKIRIFMDHCARMLNFERN